MTPPNPPKAAAAIIALTNARVVLLGNIAT
jgi:hypothetical protein